MKPAVVSRTRVAATFVLVVVLFGAADAATLLVYNTNDSGAGSLRQAIADNATMGGGNAIIFSNFVTGTMTLTFHATELAIGFPARFAFPHRNHETTAASGWNGSRFSRWDFFPPPSGFTARTFG